MTQDAEHNLPLEKTKFSSLITFLRTHEENDSVEDKCVKARECGTSLGLARARESFFEGKYREAVLRLVSFILTNQDRLNLQLHIMSASNILDDALNASAGDNHAVIRNAQEIQAIAAQIERDGHKLDAQRLQRLAEEASQLGRYALLMDKYTSDEEAYKELVHELNIWLFTGAYLEIQDVDDWHKVSMPVWDDDLDRWRVVRSMDAWMINKPEK